MRIRIAMLLAALAAVTIASCDHDEIRVEMISRDNTMYRQVIVYRTNATPQSLPEPTTVELDRLAQEVTARMEVPLPPPPPVQLASPGLLGQISPFYPPQYRTQGPDNVTVFRGQFPCALPADVGNGGAYAIYQSLLGNAYSYVETFSSNADVAGSRQYRIEHADRLVDLLIGWLQSELGDEPNFPALRQFLDGPFRQDVQSAALLQPCEARGDDVLPVIYQFAADLSPAPGQGLAGLQGPLPPGIRERVGAMLNLPPDSRKLEFLSAVEPARESLEKYLATTPEYQQRLSAWRQQQAGATAPPPEGVATGSAATCPATQPAVATNPPAPIDIFNDALGRFVADLSATAPEHLAVTLAPPQRPFQTNGQWLDDGARVIWANNAGRCEALWTWANSQFQMAHLGSLVLDDRELYDYVLWRVGLCPRDGKAWDAMLQKTLPERAREQIAAFRFPSEKKGVCPPNLEAGRKMLVERLPATTLPAF